jgi:formylglycine-generating enzyme required for sulfatase activity
VWSGDKVPGANGQVLRSQAEQRLAQARAEANRPALQPAPVGATATASASASGKACPECPETVLIQPGSFQMGSPSGEAGRDSDEGPVRTVRIGYQLAVGKTLVTRGEFAAFVAATGYRSEAEQGDGCTVWTGSQWEHTAGRSWRGPGFEQGSDHPVVCVSWNDAQKYIEWLNGKSPVKGWRLLSEAEWEYAARAGTSTRYFWGDEGGNSQQCRFANGLDQSAKRSVPGASGWDVANCEDGHAYTAPVGRLQPNAWGLQDMAGNASQWTQDCYAQSYEGAPSNGQAVNPSSCSQRVLRGGSWIHFPQRLRSADRNWGSPDYRFNFSGFRIARTVFRP